MVTKRMLVKNVIRLSIPAILAEVSSMVMQYIDAAMVGSLGANETASIGLVASSTWLIGGLCIGAATGFSVQVAQFIGAGKVKEAKQVLRQSIIVCLVFSLLLMAAGIGISGQLPVWLGGNQAIHSNATKYFFVYACSLPAIQFRYLFGSMLQCSGDMKTPSILNGMMCGLDVVFNVILIFGAHLGVFGAALGTAFAEGIVAVAMMYFACINSEKINLKEKGSWHLQKNCMIRAIKIGLPMSFEHTVMCGAQVMSTRIVAPLGTKAVAANALAVTAESFCYMPGYGIGSAATTLVGQSIGAKDQKKSRDYARVSVLLGITVMTVAGILMYFLAPLMMQMLTRDAEVRALGVKVLRIEVLAEPFYAASIVVTGALRGAGDTLIPSIMSLVSMWGVRISLAWFLAPRFGLVGVWIAMCVELIFRGVIFLYRLLKERWLNRPIYE